MSSTLKKVRARILKTFTESPCLSSFHSKPSTGMSKSTIILVLIFITTIFECHGTFMNHFILSKMDPRMKNPFEIAREKFVKTAEATEEEVELPGKIL